MKPPSADLSATEIDLGKRCLRLWAARYVWDEWPREPRTATNIGSGLHNLAEAYLLRGARPNRVDPISELFIEGLPHLPAPGAWEVERESRLVIDGLPFAVKLDVSTHAGDQITDFKTCKNYNHTKDSKELKLGDVQSVLYAYAKPKAAAEEWPVLRDWAHHPDGTVSFRHVYFRKHRPIVEMEVADALNDPDPEVQRKARNQIKYAVVHPQAKAFDATFTHRELRGAMERVVLPVAGQVFELRQRTRINPLDLPPNLDACYDFNRPCFQMQRCLTPVEQMHAAANHQRKQEMSQTGMFPALPPTNGPSAAPAQAWQPPAQAAPQQPPAQAWQPPAQAAPQQPAQAWQPPAQAAPQQPPAQQYAPPPQQQQPAQSWQPPAPTAPQAAPAQSWQPPAQPANELSKPFAQPAQPAPANDAREARIGALVLELLSLIK